MRPFQQNAEFDDPLKLHLSTGTFQWIGLPDVYDIWKILPIADHTDLVVLLKTESSRRSTLRNLLCCHADGAIVLRAELPENSNNSYTSVEWRGQELSAFSWSCHSVVLNVETGDIVSSVFTK